MENNLEDLFEQYKSGPFPEEYQRHRRILNATMAYRESRSANFSALKQRRRRLNELRNSHIIELDLQQCVLNLERRMIQQKALAIAQQIDCVNEQDFADYNNNNYNRQNFENNRRKIFDYRQENDDPFQLSKGFSFNANPRKSSINNKNLDPYDFRNSSNNQDSSPNFVGTFGTRKPLAEVSCPSNFNRNQTRSGFQTKFANARKTENVTPFSMHID